MKSFLILFFCFLSLSSALEYVDPYLINELNQSEEVRSIVFYSQNDEFNSNYSEIFNLSKFILENLSNSIEVERMYYDYPINILGDYSKEVTGFNQINKYSFSEREINGSGYSVCLIDSGVYYKNSELGGCLGQEIDSKCSIIGGYDFVNLDSDAEDDNGHGSHIAGTILEIIPEVKIIPVKVTDNLGAGYSSDVIKGIEYCLNISDKLNLKVIGLSLSTDCVNYPSSCSDKTYCENSVFSESINRAYEKNISVVSAVGNSGLEVLPAPACVKNSIRVGAIDENLEFWARNNRNDALKLVAPGINIMSAWIEGRKEASGTSMAVPYVMGALIYLERFSYLIDYNFNKENKEELFYESGSRLSYNLKNYSIINITNAINLIEKRSKNVSIEIQNDAFKLNQEGILKCKINSEFNFSRVTFKIFNETEIIYKREINYSNFNEIKYSFNKEGNYHWNCEFSIENYSIISFYNKTIIIAKDIVIQNLNVENEIKISGGGGSSVIYKNYTNYTLNKKIGKNISDLPILINSEKNISTNIEKKAGITGNVINGEIEDYSLPLSFILALFLIIVILEILYRKEKLKLK